MDLEVIRFSSGTDSTNGILLEVNKHAPAPHAEGFRCKRTFLAYTLEDEYRSEKKYGETRIPNGTYKLALRKTGGYHQKYSKRFPDIHVGMLHVTDVPNFEYILIHCVIPMSIQLVVSSLVTPKKITKSRRTVL